MYLLRDSFNESFVAEVPSTTGVADLLEGELNIKDDSNGSESILVGEVNLEDPPRSDCKFASRSSFFKAITSRGWRGVFGGLHPRQRSLIDLNQRACEATA